MLQQTTEQKEQTREILKLVTAISKGMEDPESANEWYQRLFFDETENGEKTEAEERLLNITDDITVLLAWGLAAEPIASDDEAGRVPPLPGTDEKQIAQDEATEKDKNGLKQKKKTTQMLRFLSKLIGLKRHPSEEEQHET